MGFLPRGEVLRREGGGGEGRGRCPLTAAWVRYRVGCDLISSHVVCTILIRYLVFVHILAVSFLPFLSYILQACTRSSVYICPVCINFLEERWLNGSAPDCKSVVLGSNPAPPQHTANSASPEVGSHLGWHSTVCWPLRGGRGTYTQKPIKI